MIRGSKSVVPFFVALVFINAVATAGSFICSEPGGKRLIYISDKEISKESDRGKVLLYIDGNDILTNPTAGATFVVDDHDIRHSAAGLVIARFDGDDIRHGSYADGKVMINYHHPDLCPNSAADRIYSIEGDPISKQQLVAGLYLLKPEMFKLSDAEIAAQKKEIKEAGEEQDRKDAADQVAGKWDVLNSNGIMEKLGAGTITVDAKKGDAYPVNIDLTKGGGPQWTGVGVYKLIVGDKFFWTAYGTPKTVAICAYDIDGGTLKGTWYPWYVNGDAKNVGTETLTGPESLDGEFKIEAGKAPFTGAAYSGTVTIKPATIVGTSDDAKPYKLTWMIGGTKINGIGIRSKNLLFVATGTGADVNIARFKIGNGTMNSDWFKLGSDEMGSSAAMQSN